MTPLRQRMIEDMKVRNLARKTQLAYVTQVARFAKYFGKSPELLGPEEIHTYLVHLINDKHVSWSLFNQTACGLRFLYRCDSSERLARRTDSFSATGEKASGGIES